MLEIMPDTASLIQICLHFLILVCLKLVHQGGGICFDLPGGRDGDDVQQGLEQHEEQEQHTFDHHCDLKNSADPDVVVIDRDHVDVAEGDNGGHQPCDPPEGRGVEVLEEPSEFLAHGKQETHCDQADCVLQNKPRDGVVVDVGIRNKLCDDIVVQDTAEGKRSGCAYKHIQKLQLFQPHHQKICNQTDAEQREEKDICIVASIRIKPCKQKTDCNHAWQKDRI